MVARKCGSCGKFVRRDLEPTTWVERPMGERITYTWLLCIRCQPKVVTLWWEPVEQAVSG